MVTKNQLMSLSEHDRKRVIKIQKELAGLDKKFYRNPTMALWKRIDKLQAERDEILNG